MATIQQQVSLSERRRQRALASQPQTPSYVPQTYDETTTQGKVLATRQKIGQARTPLQQFKSQYLFPKKRERAFTDRRARAQVVQAGQGVAEQLGQIQQQEQTFEREVATKAPEYALQAQKQQALMEAKQSIQARIDDLQARIQKRLEYIERKRQDRSDKNRGEDIDRAEDDISEYRAELNEYQKGLGLGEDNLIKQHFSGYIQEKALYERDYRSRRNQQQADFNKMKQQPDFQKTLDDLKKSGINIGNNPTLTQFNQAVNKFNSNVAYKNQLLKFAEQKGGVQFLNPEQQKALGVDTQGFEYYRTPKKVWVDPRTGQVIEQSISDSIAQNLGYRQYEASAFNKQTGKYLLEGISDNLLTDQQRRMYETFQKNPRAARLFGFNIDRSAAAPTSFILGGTSQGAPQPQKTNYFENLVYRTPGQTTTSASYTIKYGSFYKNFDAKLNGILPGGVTKQQVESARRVAETLLNTNVPVGTTKGIVINDAKGSPFSYVISIIKKKDGIAIRINKPTSAYDVASRMSPYTPEELKTMEILRKYGYTSLDGNRVLGITDSSGNLVTFNLPETSSKRSNLLSEINSYEDYRSKNNFVANKRVLYYEKRLPSSYFENPQEYKKALYTSTLIDYENAKEKRGDSGWMGAFKATAVQDTIRRLRLAGWTEEEIDNFSPVFKEAKKGLGDPDIRKFYRSVGTGAMFVSPILGAGTLAMLDVIDYDDKLKLNRQKDIAKPSWGEIATVAGVSFGTNLVMSKIIGGMTGRIGKGVTGIATTASTKAFGKTAGAYTQQAFAGGFQGLANYLTGSFYRSTATELYSAGRQYSIGNKYTALLSGTKTLSGLAGFYAPNIYKSQVSPRLSALRQKFRKITLTEVTFNEPGRGLVKGYVVGNVPQLDTFKSGKRIVKQVDINKLKDYQAVFNPRLGRTIYIKRVQQPSIRKPSTWKDYITGRKVGQIKEVRFQKKGEILLKDTPSQLSDPSTQLLLGRQGSLVMTQVSPGRSAFGLKKQFTVKEQRGSIILRSFAEGAEKGYFLAPPSRSVTSKVRSDIQRKIDPRNVDVDNVQKVIIQNLKGEVIGGSFSLNVLYKGFPRKFKDLDIISRNPRATVNRILASNPSFKVKEGSQGKFTISFKGKDVADVVPSSLYRKYGGSIFGVPSRDIGGVRVLREDIVLKGKLDTIKYGSTPESKIKAQKDVDFLLQAKILRLPSGTPQAYTHYAGIGEQRGTANLYDYLSGKAKVVSGRPSITMIKERVSNVQKELLKKKVTPQERTEVKNILDSIRRGEWVDKGLTIKDADRLLQKYGGIDQLALHRRLSLALNRPGQIVPGVGALSGLRTEYEAIGTLGTKFTRFAGRFKSFMSRGDYKIFLPRERATFDVVFAKMDKPVETSKQVSKAVKDIITMAQRPSQGERLITLYHGTDSRSARNIATSGLKKGGWLTKSKNVAMDYLGLDKAGDDVSGAILKVQVTSSELARMRTKGKLKFQLTKDTIPKDRISLEQDFDSGLKSFFAKSKPIKTTQIKDNFLVNLVATERVTKEASKRALEYSRLPTYSPRPLLVNLPGQIIPRRDVSRKDVSRTSRTSYNPLVVSVRPSTSSVSKPSTKSGLSLNSIFSSPSRTSSPRSPRPSTTSLTSYKSPPSRRSSPSIVSPPRKTSGGSTKSPPPSLILPPSQPSRMSIRQKPRPRPSPQRQPVRRPVRANILPTITQQIYRVRRKGGKLKRSRGFEIVRV